MPFRPLFFALEVDGDEDAEEVEHSGEYRASCNFAIAHAEEFGHQEGGCAHDGRHYLPAGGGGGLDGACKFGAVAGLFHHGYSDGAGADGVGDGGAGGHALEGGGYDGDLRGATGGGTGHAVSKVYKEIGDACPLKEGAEDNKHDDELGADVDRRGKYAVDTVEYRVDETVKGYAGGKGVDDQRACDEKYGQAYAAAAQLYDGEYAYKTDDRVERSHRRCASDRLDKSVVGEGVVEERGGSNHHDDYIVPWKAVHLYMLLAYRVGNEAKYEHAAHEESEPFLNACVGEKGRDYAVDGENRHEDINGKLGCADPNSGIGLLVILSHDLFNVLHGADVDVVIFFRLI